MTGEFRFFSEAKSSVEGEPDRLLMLYDSALNSTVRLCLYALPVVMLTLRQHDVAGPSPMNQSNERTADEDTPVKLCLSTLDGLDKTLSSAAKYKKERRDHLSLAGGPLDNDTINQSTHLHLETLNEVTDHYEGVFHAARVGIWMAGKEFEAVNSAPISLTAHLNRMVVDASPLVQPDTSEEGKDQHSSEPQRDDKNLPAKMDQSFIGPPCGPKAPNLAGDSDSNPSKDVQPVLSEEDRPWGPGWAPISDEAFEERNRKRKRDEMSVAAWNDDEVVPYNKTYRSVRRSARKR